MKKIFNSFLIIFLGYSILGGSLSCSGSHPLSTDFQKDWLEQKTVETSFGKEEFRITEKTVNPKGKRDYYWFRAGEVHHSTGDYAGKLLNGSYINFYEDYGLREKGIFKKGIKSGTWYQWHPSGTIAKEQSFNGDGFLHGRYVELDQQGELLWKGRYRNGLKQGKWINFVTEDTLEYKKGKIKQAKYRKSIWKVFKKRDTLRIDSLATEDSKAPGFWKKLFTSKEGKEKMLKTKDNVGDKESTFKKQAKDKDTIKKGIFSRIFKRSSKEENNPEND